MVVKTLVIKALTWIWETEDQVPVLHLPAY